MKTTKISSKGQVVIPKSIRKNYGWAPGQELVVIETEDGIVLKPKKPFEETSLDEVAGCLEFQGRTKTLEEFEEGIRKGALQST